IKEWFNRFKHGRMSADSEQRSGRPSTSRNADVIEKVWTLIMEDRRLAIREVADEVGISRGSANTILTEDLGMRRVAAKFLWDARNWQLHHDNAPAHSSHLIQGFLAKHGILQVRQAPYSPDMAPSDFWLFPRVKTPLKPTVGNASLHEISNDNGVRVVNFATSKNLTIRSTMFLHRNIHKFTWTSPDGKIHNEIDHILIYRKGS
ncbi:hypothetical protein B7P43_G12822, partial [Cryptotermes secundus]